MQITMLSVHPLYTFVGMLSSQDVTGGFTYLLCLQRGRNGKMLCAFIQKDIKRTKAITYIQQSEEETPPTQSKTCSRTAASVVRMLPSLNIYIELNGY